jgi:DNA (cytosine-5)-methyltransferase 1
MKKAGTNISKIATDFNKKSMYSPITKSFFAGGGGLDQGFMEAGCTVTESLEIDPVACQTLRMNFKHKVNEADITQETVLGKDDCDVMTFTWPCKKYSKMANLHGTRTGEELFLHAFRHVALYQPEAFVCENVLGMKKFKVVMEAFTKLPNYWVQVFCPLNASTWLPQNRQRLIVIATKRKFFIQEPAPSVRRPTIKSILEKDVEFELPFYVQQRLNGQYRDKPVIVDPADKYALAPTATAHYGKDLGQVMVKDPSQPFGVRPWTTLEFQRLQGFPDDYKFAGCKTDVYKQIGNAVPVKMGRWVGEQMVRYFNQSTSRMAA